MSLSFKQNLIRNLFNIPGWRTNRKIVVIESDDWGSIRVPSREVYLKLLKKGIRVDLFPYNRYDSLESETDLISLFEVLSVFRDKSGNFPIFTMNMIVANPDFDKIRQADFKEYFYEPFTKTYTSYPEHSRSLLILKDGFEKRLIKPQFHGREHINVNRWMNGLKNENAIMRLAFEYRMFDLSTDYNLSEHSFIGAFNFCNSDELSKQKQILIEGTKLFENIFGYKSQAFIAPYYIWSSTLNETLKNCGIETIQGNYLQLEPKGVYGLYNKRFHFTGQVNQQMQRFTVRNVVFEPAEDTNKDCVGETISKISNSFFWKKPAIISSHRMNYIGFIDKTNRTHNLSLLTLLLRQIIHRWPDVEFMSSDELGKVIAEDQS
jgi:hypothetical protein